MQNKIKFYLMLIYLKLIETLKQYILLMLYYKLLINHANTKEQKIFYLYNMSFLFNFYIYLCR